MDRIRISGGQKLNGTIPISGAKNATLPLMIASLLTDQTLILDNVPRLADVGLLQRILGNHGVDVMVGGKRPGETQYDGQTLHISAANIIDTTAPYELVSRMRASFWVVAPLLARMGEAQGLDARRLRHRHAAGGPSDHGARAAGRRRSRSTRGYVIARAKNGLRGGEIKFPKVTVGGTHTALMAASLARGTTVIENAAREPEITRRRRLPQQDGRQDHRRRQLADRGRGRAKLNGARHRVLPDRIETGTYAMAVAMTGGDVLLENARAELLQSALDVLAQAGVEITPTNTGHAGSRATERASAPVEVTTAPFPGFPTDLQAQLMALMTRAKGTSHITETIFENRFMHVQELVRLGAHIQLDGETRDHRRGRRRSRALPSWRPICAPRSRSSSPRSRPRARPWSTASITSTAASSGWRTSSRPAAPPSSASADSRGCRLPTKKRTVYVFRKML